MAELNERPFPPAALQELQDRFGPDRILTAEWDLIAYSYDASFSSALRPGVPDVVVQPESTEDVVYAVKVVAGRVSCKTDRRLMRTFMTKNTFPRGWFCARGHASQSQKWAAACGTAAGADVKAYGPLRR